MKNCNVSGSGCNYSNGERMANAYKIFQEEVSNVILFNNTYL